MHAMARHCNGELQSSGCVGAAGVAGVGAGVAGVGAGQRRRRLGQSVRIAPLGCESFGRKTSYPGCT